MKGANYFSQDRRHSRLTLCGFASLTAVALTLNAGDWTQYRGSTHDGKSTETFTPWSGAGPKQVWKTSTTDGFSSFVISGGKAFTEVGRSVDGVMREVCVAYDANSGKELWAKALGVAKYDGGGDSGTEDNKGGDGPRSTPSVDGDRVYVFSSDLVLSCFKADTGDVVWKKDVIKEHSGKNISWKNAASPLIEGDLIFVAGGGPGEALLGINKTDGKVVWKGEDDRFTHATPVAATILGTRQVIFFTQKGLVSVKPQDGTVLWRYNFPYSVSTAASPVVANDIVYCSAGYGVGAGAVKIAQSGGSFTATELWRQKGKLMNHWSTPVYKDGYLYGMFSFKDYGKGPLKCVELATGKEMWVKEGFGAGNVILAGDLILALSDAGQLVTVQATPKAYTEVARAKVVDGKCWSTPALSNGRVYVRSTKEGVCLDTSSKVAIK